MLPEIPQGQEPGGDELLSRMPPPCFRARSASAEGPKGGQGGGNPDQEKGRQDASKNQPWGNRTGGGFRQKATAQLHKPHGPQRCSGGQHQSQEHSLPAADSDDLTAGSPNRPQEPVLLLLPGKLAGGGIENADHGRQQ